MKIKEITSFLEKFAPLALQENYDNSGLIIGDENKEITNVLLCLDSIEEVVNEAIETNCNLIIAHHPIIFSSIKKINFRNHIERTIVKAIKNDIAIYSMHTNLDNIKGGVNSKIADILSLKDQRILRPMERSLRKLVVYVPKESLHKVQTALFNSGAGSIGDYKNCSFVSEGVGTFLPCEGSDPKFGKIGNQEVVEESKIEVVFPKYIQKEVISSMKESHPYEEVAYQIYMIDNFYTDVGSGIFGLLENEIPSLEYLNMIKNLMKTECIRHTRLVKDSISKVAICGGSGSFLLSEAISWGADIFITSDFKYHEFFNHEDQIIIADIGHYESEQFTKELIYDLLVNNFSKFAVRLSKINTNPINYI